VSSNAAPALELPDDVDVGRAFEATNWSELKRRGGGAMFNLDFSPAFAAQAIAVRDALAHPRFIDTCPIEAGDSNCPWTRRRRSVRALLVDALVQANQGHQIVAVATVF
jgi:hypothetical protein